MKRRLLYTGIWVAAAAGAGVAVWQVVGAAQAQVADDPAAPVVAVTSPTTATSPPGPGDAPATTAPGAPTPTSSAAATTPPGATTGPGATAPGTATTAPPPDTGTATIPTPGGTVTVSYSGGRVVLDGAAPALGFSVDVEDEGPEEVRVEFGSETLDVEVRLRWRDGRLQTEVSTSGRDG